MGCYNPPSLKEISSWDLRQEGEHRKRWRMYWSRRKENIGTVGRSGDFSVSHVAFSFCVWATKHFDDSDHVALITWFPLCDSFIKYPGWRRPLSCSTPMLTASIGVRLQRPKWALAWVEVTFSWIEWIRWAHEAAWDHDNMARKWTNTM
jgi:hypothetical protein